MIWHPVLAAHQSGVGVRRQERTVAKLIPLLLSVKSVLVTTDADDWLGRPTTRSDRDLLNYLA